MRLARRPPRLPPVYGLPRKLDAFLIGQRPDAGRRFERLGAAFDEGPRTLRRDCEVHFRHSRETIISQHRKVGALDCGLDIADDPGCIRRGCMDVQCSNINFMRRAVVAVYRRVVVCYIGSGCSADIRRHEILMRARNWDDCCVAGADSR
jgi:hypothetical protein